MPPVVRPENARSIRIEDVDRAVKLWFDRTVDAHAVTAQGDRSKVPVLFAAGERWVAAADKRGIRDRDGRLILPVISIKRTGIDPVNNMTALGANVPRLTVSKLVSEKTSTNLNAAAKRPISQRRLSQPAVYEITTVPFPFTGNLTYQVLVQTQYNHQMNEVIEKMVSALEFFDVPSFVAPIDRGNLPGPIKSGQGQSEVEPEDHSPYEDRKPLDSYYVVGYFDGDFGDASNFDEFTDQERIIETKFTFHVPTALLLDPEGNRPAVQRELTAFTVIFNDETVVVVDDPTDLDVIFGK